MNKKQLPTTTSVEEIQYFPEPETSTLNAYLKEHNLTLQTFTGDEIKIPHVTFFKGALGKESSSFPLIQMHRTVLTLNYLLNQLGKCSNPMMGIKLFKDNINNLFYDEKDMQACPNFKKAIAKLLVELIAWIDEKCQEGKFISNWHYYVLKQLNNIYEDQALETSTSWDPKNFSADVVNEINRGIKNTQLCEVVEGKLPSAVKENYIVGITAEKLHQAANTLEILSDWADLDPPPEEEFNMHYQHTAQTLYSDLNWLGMPAKQDIRQELGANILRKRTLLTCLVLEFTEKALQAIIHYSGKYSGKRKEISEAILRLLEVINRQENGHPLTDLIKTTRTRLQSDASSQTIQEFINNLSQEILKIRPDGLYFSWIERIFCNLQSAKSNSSAPPQSNPQVNVTQTETPKNVEQLPESHSTARKAQFESTPNKAPLSLYIPKSNKIFNFNESPTAQSAKESLEQLIEEWKTTQNHIEAFRHFENSGVTKIKNQETNQTESLREVKDALLKRLKYLSRTSHYAMRKIFLLMIAEANSSVLKRLKLSGNTSVSALKPLLENLANHDFETENMTSLTEEEIQYLKETIKGCKRMLENYRLKFQLRYYVKLCYQVLENLTAANFTAKDHKKSLALSIQIVQKSQDAVREKTGINAETLKGLKQALRKRQNLEHLKPLLETLTKIVQETEEKLSQITANNAKQTHLIPTLAELKTLTSVVSNKVKGETNNQSRLKEIDTTLKKLKQTLENAKKTKSLSEKFLETQLTKTKALKEELSNYQFLSKENETEKNRILGDLNKHLYELKGLKKNLKMYLKKLKDCKAWERKEKAAQNPEAVLSCQKELSTHTGRISAMKESPVFKFVNYEQQPNEGQVESQNKKWTKIKAQHSKALQEETNKKLQLFASYLKAEQGQENAQDADRLKSLKATTKNLHMLTQSQGFWPQLFNADFDPETVREWPEDLSKKEFQDWQKMYQEKEAIVSKLVSTELPLALLTRSEECLKIPYIPEVLKMASPEDVAQTLKVYLHLAQTGKVTPVPKWQVILQDHIENIEDAHLSKIKKQSEKLKYCLNAYLVCPKATNLYKLNELVQKLRPTKLETDDEEICVSLIVRYFKILPEFIQESFAYGVIVNSDEEMHKKLTKKLERMQAPSEIIKWSNYFMQRVVLREVGLAPKISAAIAWMQAAVKKLQANSYEQNLVLACIECIEMIIDKGASEEMSRKHSILLTNLNMLGKTSPNSESESLVETAMIRFIRVLTEGRSNKFFNPDILNPYQSERSPTLLGELQRIHILELFLDLHPLTFQGLPGKITQRISQAPWQETRVHSYKQNALEKMKESNRLASAMGSQFDETSQVGLAPLDNICRVYEVTLEEWKETPKSNAANMHYFQNLRQILKAFLNLDQADRMFAKRDDQTLLIAALKRLSRALSGLNPLTTKDEREFLSNKVYLSATVTLITLCKALLAILTKKNRTNEDVEKIQSGIERLDRKLIKSTIESHKDEGEKRSSIGKLTNVFYQLCFGSAMPTTSPEWANPVLRILILREFQKMLNPYAHYFVTWTEGKKESVLTISEVIELLKKQIPYNKVKNPLRCSEERLFKSIPVPKKSTSKAASEEAPEENQSLQEWQESIKQSSHPDDLEFKAKANKCIEALSTQAAGNSEFYKKLPKQVDILPPLEKALFINNLLQRLVAKIVQTGIEEWKKIPKEQDDGEARRKAVYLNRIVAPIRLLVATDLFKTSIVQSLDNELLMALKLVVTELASEYAHVVKLLPELFIERQSLMHELIIATMPKDRATPHPLTRRLEERAKELVKIIEGKTLQENNIHLHEADPPKKGNLYNPDLLGRIEDEVLKWFNSKQKSFYSNLVPMFPDLCPNINMLVLYYLIIPTQIEGGKISVDQRRGFIQEGGKIRPAKHNLKLDPFLVAITKYLRIPPKRATELILNFFTAIDYELPSTLTYNRHLQKYQIATRDSAGPLENPNYADVEQCIRALKFMASKMPWLKSDMDRVEKNVKTGNLPPNLKEKIEKIIPKIKTHLLE